MKLVIQAHALKSEPLSQAITGRFDERGGTIGRSDTNTLTLPDPERHVSRLQAEVVFAGGAFSIRNVGSANPIELNGRALDPGEGAPLAEGDQLVIGGYAMQVTADAQPGAGTVRAKPRADSRTVIRASASEPRTDPPPLAAEDPFADLIAPPSASSSAPRRSAAKAPAPAVAAQLPDDFDPFADLAPPLANPADADMAGFMASPAVPAPDSFAGERRPPPLGMDDLLGLLPAGSGSGSAAPSLDTMFGLGGQGGGNEGADLLDDFLAPGKPGTGAVSGDVLDLFAEKPAGPSGRKAGAAFNHTPELAGAYSPPAVKAPPVAKVPVAPTPRPAAPARPAMAQPLGAPLASDAASPAALWQAFCDGAGISLRLPQDLNPQMMRVMGQLMHHAMEGTLKLVAVRAAAKQELRAQVTTIQSKNNNPLKFSADAQAVLAQLLQPPLRGFLPGPDAVRDVMDDLLGHNIGTMAGTRAALEGMLKRFEPAQLEARLSSNGVIDALLPMHRRAKLWELYVEHYQQVQGDAQEDFHELFGKAFVKAYEQQLDQLEAARRKAH